MANIIDAIINLVNNPVCALKETYARKNRANSAGDPLKNILKIYLQLLLIF